MFFRFEPLSTDGQEALADAYAFLQKAVGLVAVTLPFVVAIGNEVSGGRMQDSISSYYYTHLGNYFVGSLCALGVFFLSYNYRPLPKYQWDNYLSDVAGLMAICVALFPTTSDSVTASGGEKVIGGLHLFFAAVLFVLLAVFSWFFFTRTSDTQPVTKKKQLRNRVYKICAVIIAITIVLMFVTAKLVQPPSGWHTLFWLESVAVVAFGFSWLVKGGFLGWFADQ